jgi:lipoprotein-anchoring transpeptidase ErfK/SrfK
MGKNNTELLKIAQKHLGQGGAVFRKYCGLPSGAAWCNAFVTYIFNEGGDSALYCNGKKMTYCPTSIKWCKDNLAQIPLYLAMPMDVIYFDWDRNGVPNHIGFVRARHTTSDIYTIEGNTSNKVMNKTRPSKYVCGIYRPHFKPTYTLKKLTVDGECGYNTIAGLQKSLGCTVDGILGKATVKALQKKVGVTADGAWGNKTSMAVQKMLGVKIDGQFGPASVKALQNWINKKAFPSSTAGSPAVTKPTTPSKPKATLKSYRIEIDLTNQIGTVYGIYSDKSSKVMMSEFVSTARKGKTTPTGNFKISGASGGRKAKLRTAKMESGKSYAEYLCRFHGAKCMHCVPYRKRNTTGHVDKTEFNKLGTPASGGCVRMPWKLAHYIYTNCPVGTPVKVFKGTKGKFPGGKPKKYTAKTNLDPTYKK